MAALGSAITAGLMIGTMSNEHWQTAGPAWTAWTPVVQTVGKCSKNTAARPPAPTVAPNSPMSFHAAITASPAVRPDHGPDRPEAGDRGLMGLQFGHPDFQPHRGRLAQMVLGLGHDQLRLGRRDPQPGVQLLQVPGDQVAGHPVHAGRPGSAWAGPAAGGHTA